MRPSVRPSDRPTVRPNVRPSVRTSDRSHIIIVGRKGLQHNAFHEMCVRQCEIRTPPMNIGEYGMAEMIPEYMEKKRQD